MTDHSVTEEEQAVINWVETIRDGMRTARDRNVVDNLPHDSPVLQDVEKVLNGCIDKLSRYLNNRSY